MFGFKLVHKRELALFSAVISDLREQIKKLDERVMHEQRRAEGAINALLLKTQKLAIVPDPPPLTEDQENEMQRSALDLFNEGEEQDILERIQKI